MTGLFRTMRVGPIGPGPVSPTAYLDPAAIAFRSKPAQTVPAAPVSTPTASLSSSSKREKLAARAAAVSGSTALRTSGRSMVTVSTAPSTSTRTFLDRASLVVVFHERIAVVGRGRVRLLDHARADPADQVQEGARLVVRARRAGATERLQTDDRARRLVVDVEVAGRVDELLRSLADRLPVAGEHRAGQPVRACPVAQVERLVELTVRVGVHGEDGPEQLLAEKLEVGIGGLDHSRPDEPSDLVVALASRDDLGVVLLARVLDRVHVACVGATVDHRAHEVAEVGDIALRDRIDEVDQVGLHGLPHRLRDVRARCGGTFLALVFEG